MTHAEAPGGPDYGHLERDGERAVVRFERHLPHPPTKVWRALTEPEHLAAWFPTTIDGERAPGAELVFRFTDLDLPPMDGEMLAFEPTSLLELRWGPDALRFELAPDGDGTVLTFTARMEQFGKAARDAAGWHTSLDRLACELSGAKAPSGSGSGSGSGERWREVNEVYVARFGAQASTIGPPEEWQRAHRAQGDRR
jgi:uncharacterized protein YndB with AHSA1/START domain